MKVSLISGGTLRHPHFPARSPSPFPPTENQARPTYRDPSGPVYIRGGLIVFFSNSPLISPKCLSASSPRKRGADAMQVIIRAWSSSSSALLASLLITMFWQHSLAFLS